MVESLDCKITLIPTCETLVLVGSIKKVNSLSLLAVVPRIPWILYIAMMWKMDKKSICGAEYSLTFVDDKTHYVWVYPLKKRSNDWRSCKYGK